MRGDPQLVRLLLLGHICAGRDSLLQLRQKNCAVSISGQTHSVYTSDGKDTCVGTAKVSRADIGFDGGVLHEMTSVMLQIIVTKECHVEQVWKKTLQPSPLVAIVGGSSANTDFEVHGCLVHLQTGGIVPEAMRGHIRKVGPHAAQQVTLAFSEITVMAKPPSLAKRRGKDSEGINQYRLLFSLWNTTSTTYVSWQHMATPIVVRNSFHMLPLEEKEYRRQQYAKSRGQDKEQAAADAACAAQITLEASSSSSSMVFPPGASGSEGQPSARADSIEGIAPEQFIPPSLTHLQSSGSVGGRSAVEPRLPAALQGFSSLSSEDMNAIVGTKPRAGSGAAGAAAAGGSLDAAIAGSSAAGGVSPMRTADGGVINVLTGAPVAPPNTPAQGAQSAGFGAAAAAAAAATAAASVDLLSKPLGGAAVPATAEATGPSLASEMDDFVAAELSVGSSPSRKNSAQARMSVEVDARISRQRSSRDSGSGGVAPGQKEMLTRLLAALERGKVAAQTARLDNGESALSIFEAPAGEASPQSPSGAATGLFDYIKPLRNLLRRERRSSASMLACDLDDLARSHRRSSLEGGLMQRPTLEQLQGHDSTSQILPAEEAASIDQQITEKRKRLSGLLVNRPPAEKLQHIIDPSVK